MAARRPLPPLEDTRAVAHARHKLAPLEGQRRRFVGLITVKARTTMLVCDVFDVETGEMVTDHLWFALRVRLREARLRRGQYVMFHATIKRYRKGHGYKHDFHLRYPTQITGL